MNYGATQSTRSALGREGSDTHISVGTYAPARGRGMASSAGLAIISHPNPLTAPARHDLRP